MRLASDSWRPPQQRATERWEYGQPWLAGDVVTCPCCARSVPAKGLRSHQASSLLCRWRQSVG